jgi:S1-C subfamily serine protease
MLSKYSRESGGFIMVASSHATTELLLGLSNTLAEAVEGVGASVVGVNARQGVPSSGVHWRDGVIVTADHTIDRDENVTVLLADGRTLTATLAGRDPGTDLALLKVETGALPVAGVSHEPLKVGHIVLAVGRPGDIGLSTSWGAVSAVGGPWRTWAGGQIDQFIRPDLTMYPGFSGGALVNAGGTVAGIATSGLSRHMTLAIPVATVERVVETLLTRGRIARGYLGVGMQPVHIPDTLRHAAGGEARTGLIVISLESGGPAEAAGLMIGDILVTLNGAPVADTDDVQAHLGSESVGTSLTASILRGGQPAEVTLTIGERPQRGQ